MLVFLISVSLVNLIVSPVYGLINIESQPAKVENGKFVKLTCDVGTMENTVKWVYGGVTYFSCDPPYTNCLISTKNHGYNFSVNEESLIVILPVSKKRNDGIWYCYHGKEKADFKIDNADAPQIADFRSTPLEGENGKYSFECRVESKMPVDVVIYSHTYLGVKKLYEKNQTLITEHSITTSVGCADYRIFCNVTNGYGPVISNYTSVTKECPVKILHNLSPNTTLTFNETGLNTHLEFMIYFEGNPNPSTEFSRVPEDHFKHVTHTPNFFLHSYYPTWFQPGYCRIIFQNLEESDAGEYFLTLEQISRFHRSKTTILTLVYTGKAGGSIQKSTSMIQTVLFPLVFIMFFFGLLCYNRIKRKQAGSEDLMEVANDMNRRYREDIRQNYAYLTREIPLELILPSLYEILHPSDYESLRRRSKNNSDWSCNQDLLNCLQKREYWWQAFREALASINRTDIIQRLGWDENTFDFGPSHENIQNQERSNKNWMCIKNKMTWLKDLFQQRMRNNTQNGDMSTKVLYQKIRTEEI